MAVTYSAAVKTARMTATRDACADGTLEILTSADAVLVTHGLSATGGTVANGVWTVTLDAASVNATATGTAAKAQIKTSGGTVAVSGLTVATSGADINIQNTSIATGQPINYTGALTITHAP